VVPSKTAGEAAGYPALWAADPSAKTKTGQTPGDLAKEHLEYGISSMLWAEAARIALYEAIGVIAALAAVGAIAFVRAVGVRGAIRAVAEAIGAISAAATVGATAVVRMAWPADPHQQVS